MRRLLLGCLFSLLTTLPLYADNVQKGYEAFQRKDWPVAYQLWLPEAEAGNPKAQFYLSVLYEQGIGVPPSPDLSKNWLTKAAEGGFPAAQFNLGNLYQQGTWVELDDSKSAFWWQKAAEQGFAKAQFNLASLYYLGRGVDQNSNMAVHWYNQAADQGFERAKEMLAELGKPYKGKATKGWIEKGAVIAAVSKKTPNTRSEDKNINKNKVIKDEVEVKKDVEPLKIAQKAPSFESGSWILAQPDENYTVQIFASGSSESATRREQSLEISGQSATFSYSRFGQVWYAVIVGSYATREEAKRVIDSLPDEVKQGKPWIKRFKKIKEAMNKG